MAFIQVYFNEALQGEVALRSHLSDPVSIGRDADNDIAVDNAGVSALHAVIWKEGDHYVIADAASTNGLLINGQCTHRKALEPGDTIQLPKYTLKFARASAGCGPFGRGCGAAPSGASQKTTIEVDLAQLGDRLAARASAASASLRPSTRGGKRREYTLDKVNVRIGRASRCEIRTGAWLGPAISATVTRRSDGYYVRAEGGARVLLNGAPVLEPTRMSDGDHLVVRRYELTFHDRAARSARDT